MSSSMKQDLCSFFESNRQAALRILGSSVGYVLVAVRDSGIEIYACANPTLVPKDAAIQLIDVAAAANRVKISGPAEPHPAEGRTRLSLALEGWLAERTPE